MINLKGSIVDVYSHNDENLFSVIKVKPLPSDKLENVNFDGEFISVVGHIKEPKKGSIVEIEGVLNQNPKYGQQLKANLIIPSELTKQEFSKEFLNSGIIRSVNKEVSELLWSSFKERTFEVIQSQPSLIKDLTGLPASKVESMQKEVSKKLSQGLDYQFNFLKNLGVSDEAASSVVEMFGKKSVEVASKDPFALLSAPSIDFHSVDNIALTLNTTPDTDKRIYAGINHIYDSKVGSGHTAINKYDLIFEASMLLGIDDSTVGDVLANKIEQKRFVENKGKLTSYSIYAIERDIVNDLVRLSEAGNNTPNATPDLSGTQLNKEQRNSVYAGLNNNVSILTGGPGTGKSTSLKGIVDNFEEAFDGDPKVLVLASTGKAARRAGQAAEKEANTIHSALGYSPGGGFKKNRSNPLDVDLVIVDESSMVDLPAFSALLKAMPSKSKLLMGGDIHQLASVGYGNVLGDMINSKAIATTELIQVYRQPGGSNIKTTAIDVKDGELTDYGKDTDDFRFIPTSNDNETHKVVHSLLENLMTSDGGSSSIQFLSPMHGGLLGVKALNKELQELMNPKTDVNYAATFYGTEFRTGDKIMQIKNNRELDVFNGEVGEINFFDYKKQQAWANFDDKIKAIPFDDFKDIHLAYATTVHKSQGSEYETVVMPISSDHKSMVKRQNIYTAITRGKENVILVGDEETLIKGIQDAASTKRETSLSIHLANAFNVKDVEPEVKKSYEISMDF